jgi:hypothetical protein
MLLWPAMFASHASTWGRRMPGYYCRQQLADFGKIADTSPELGKTFFDYCGGVFADGALTAREKSSIALAVADAAHIRGAALLVHGMQMRQMAQKLGQKLGM